MRVDKDDNVWAVDEGTNVILKFSPDGKLLMVLGKRPDPHRSAGADAGRRRRTRAPTGRTRSIGRPTSRWDPQGNIFVSDGYTDSRVVKYDKNGRFIKSLGTRGNGAAAVQHAARDLGRRARASSTSPIAATRASSCSTTI